MVSISEDYISFETAKLLKEKGFPLKSTNFKDWVFCMYDENGGIQWGCYHPDWYARVTLQMAMKWLREVHHVACFICPSIEQGFHTNKWNSYIDKLSDNFPKDPLWFVETSDSYEQACEAAIKYCLENLI